MTYPKPYRRPRGHNEETAEIGWDEGELVDGRPFLAEAWADGGMTAVTFFFSRIGLEEATPQDLEGLLVESDLVRVLRPGAIQRGMPARDDRGAPAWSVSVVVAVEDEHFAEDRLALRPYATER